MSPLSWKRMLLREEHKISRLQTYNMFRTILFYWNKLDNNRKYTLCSVSLYQDKYHHETKRNVVEYSSKWQHSRWLSSIVAVNVVTQWKTLQTQWWLVGAPITKVTGILPIFFLTQQWTQRRCGYLRDGSGAKVLGVWATVSVSEFLFFFRRGLGVVLVVAKSRGFSFTCLIHSVSPSARYWNDNCMKGRNEISLPVL